MCCKISCIYLVWCCTLFFRRGFISGLYVKHTNLIICSMFNVQCSAPEKFVYIFYTYFIYFTHNTPPNLKYRQYSILSKQLLFKLYFSFSCSIMNMDKKIYDFMKNILCEYSEIRAKNSFESNKFWDAVIISASDESQVKGYKKQIKKKQSLKEIPVGVPFHIFADPPGHKIGCGGSTMFILDELFQFYENELLEMKILFIPAGGYSQRLPIFSALGKLFCSLPFGDTNYQMLDLILATYLPFLKNMRPGVFLASSDAIISYIFNANADNWTFNNEGFTALAHPSPVSVGCGHGVYVLPPFEVESTSASFMSDCVKVLQKPSMEQMYENGAVTSFKSDDGDKEVVFGDSAFFFDHKISFKLRKFYNINKPLKHELSSYGEFLQPLGSSANPSYIVEKETDEELALQRSALYRNLHGTKLSILVLKHSYFHHLGTMTEYLDSFCFKNKFSEVFPVCRFSFSSWSVNGVIPLYVGGTVIHSVIHPMTNLYESSLIEYCDINIAMDIGENCIISNIQLQGFPVQRLPYSIPDNTLLHTVAVLNGFVTIACNIKDDIKKKYESRHLFEVKFFGKRLKASLAINLDCFAENCDNFCLWNAKLFPVKDTPKESFMETLKIISCKTDEDMHDAFYSLDDGGVKLISMGDVLLLKDTDKMIDYQRNLYYKIKEMK